jgi:CTP synthase (UTP-ammonia lyase)
VTDGAEIVGRSLDGKFVDIVKIPSHPVNGGQFIEFKSKPLKPHPSSQGSWARATGKPPSLSNLPRPW